jgi:divalent metal cation (Fe/Co/Zn/Cd) transporter
VNSRSDHVAAAIRWSILSVAWALLVGVASLAVGVTARSTALVGFGLNSVVDGTASVVLVHRFRHERLGRASADEMERRAAAAIGTVLIAIALYLLVRASLALADGSGPDSAPVGVALTAASLAALPCLATMKLRLARELGSPALRADGVLSAAGAGLAAATLTGLLLDAGPGWWWADSVAAIVIALTLVREGAATVRVARRL